MQARVPCIAARSLNRGTLLLHTLRSPHAIRFASSKSKPIPIKKGPAKPLPYQPPKIKPVSKPLPEDILLLQQQESQRKKTGNEKAPIADLVRERWIAILGFGSAILCLGYFTASLTMYWRQEPATIYPVGLEPEIPTGRPSIQSPYEFDLHLDKSEWRFGITRLRRELGLEARGHVLEVAIGTGRNLEFYGWGVVTDSLVPAEEKLKKKGEEENDILSFTGVDISPGMLDIALKRLRQVVPHMDGQVPKKPSFAILATSQRNANKETEGHVVSFLDDRIRLLQSDVSTGLPTPPSTQKKYDTILQTFGLCSVKDPVALLSLMASSVTPNTGRILLLEHGRSVWDIVNGLLDRGARGHHERFGCWWNRDIEVIVAAAAHRVPGLEIVRLERPGWTTAGTHVVVELRVRDAAARDDKPEKDKLAGWASLLPIPSLLSVKDAKKEG